MIDAKPYTLEELNYDSGYPTRPARLRATVEALEKAERMKGRRK